VADVNGDGQLDLLTANHGSSTAGVLLGTGTGAFGPVSLFSTGAGSNPNNLAVADVNGDGQLDLLTANLGSSTVGVLLGTGTGSFGTVNTLNVGNSFPASIAVADVNGDSKPDLLIANLGSDTAGVLLGTGTGSFGTMCTFDVGVTNRPFAIVVADVNGDGQPDLLTANTNGGSVGVLLGTGTGSFGAVSTFSTGGNAPDDVAVADVNGDGKPDLLAANRASDAVGVLLGTGMGAFGTASIFSTLANSTPVAIAVADVNGDGQPDLLTANFNSSTVGVMLNTTVLATAAVLPAAAVDVYPNPAHAAFSVQVPGVGQASSVQATLLNGLGQVVRCQPAALPLAGTTLLLETAGLAAGVYTLRLTAGATVLARRVVVQ